VVSHSLAEPKRLRAATRSCGIFGPIPRPYAMTFPIHDSGFPPADLVPCHRPIQQPSDNSATYIHSHIRRRRDCRTVRAVDFNLRQTGAYNPSRHNRIYRERVDDSSARSLPPLDHQMITIDESRGALASLTAPSGARSMMMKLKSPRKRWTSFVIAGEESISPVAGTRPLADAGRKAKPEASSL